MIHLMEKGQIFEWLQRVAGILRVYNESRLSAFENHSYVDHKIKSGCNFILALLFCATFVKMFCLSLSSDKQRFFFGKLLLQSYFYLLV